MDLNNTQLIESVFAGGGEMGARMRALDWSATVPGGDDFDADIAERYGWVNRTLDDNDLDSFVDTLAQRLASFDRETWPRRRPSSIGPGPRQLASTR